LLQWKAQTGLSDKGFEKLIKIMKKKLPKDNKLPDSMYEAKKVLYPLGLEVQKIHACINDCILYHGEEYKNLEACLVREMSKTKEMAPVREKATTPVREKPTAQVKPKILQSLTRYIYIN
jgi:hypothetical protein